MPSTYITFRSRHLFLNLGFKEVQFSMHTISYLFIYLFLIFQPKYTITLEKDGVD